jgi:hypothetical protein
MMLKAQDKGPVKVTHKDIMAFLKIICLRK